MPGIFVDVDRDGFSAEGHWVKKAHRDHVCRTCRQILPKGTSYYRVDATSGSKATTLPRSGDYCKPECVVRPPRKTQ